jgi:dihydrofolate reductase
MRKLVVSMNVTVDGYMAGVNWELDWHFECWSREMADTLCEQLSRSDTILLGRVTYNAMAQYWPAKCGDPGCRGEDFAFANMMNSYTKVVFSNTITSATWHNSKVIKGNIQKKVAKLKQQPGKDMIIYGSGKLVSTLLHLVDEYQLWLHPVALGNGKPLFAALHNQLKMTLVKVKKFDSGVIVLYYRSGPLTRTII